MARILAKLFRDPRHAAAALDELKKKGFGAEEIGIVSRPNGHEGQKVAFPGLGEVVAAGPVQGPVSQASATPEGALSAALAQVLGVPADAAGYYEFGVSIGGVLVTVHTEDDRAQTAREVLRVAAPGIKPTLTNNRSPGFLQAERMMATDPVDAPMSGDFRKY